MDCISIVFRFLHFGRNDGVGEARVKDNKMNKLIIFFIVMGCMSCGDQFLDIKPGSDTVVPTTLDDFQQLLDASSLRWAPELLDLQADDYYLQQAYWNSMGNVVFKNAHVWADDIYETVESETYGWNTLYEQILYANVVLDGLSKVTVDPKRHEFYNHIKGSALFVRAMALHYLMQLYSPAYHSVNSNSDLGIPVPLSSDVNEKVKREPVAVCYKRIIDDLKESVPLLRAEVDFGRPSKVASYALLARTYLMMGDYSSALIAADNSLFLYSDLADFNQVKSRDYKKTIYLTFMAPATLIRNNSNNTLIDETLYDSYADNDLRKTVFYKIGNQGSPIKIDSYGLSIYCFSGLDTDEQYLIKAECQARIGDKDECMKTLNHLLRHVHSNYVDQVATDKEEALSMILQERRKQLLFRGLRWMDLKRYNRDGANITLTRELGDRIYKLEPNSLKWLFPLPANEIKTSGIPQNIRK